jgi:hypothetical protein
MNILNLYAWRIYVKFLDFADWFRGKELTEIERKIQKCEEFRIELRERSNSCPQFLDKMEIELNDMKLDYDIEFNLS